ncbi:rhodanese-like domain-containing protein [Evansella cellulosilytica]|uniref:Rhodanese domain protein n=1 Tax=Evansella cellulosilytica (strain ATCC 21833 / DSM 2522 / FERM P-1141 / JCM 9156 / N-4) TaxID=649639 RepID=E6TX02_EVAC2|nr:rhodanese-like domain-containing protein [Evansella cellulosilytica]ADU29952.1 Rhodanese domain protein [Evansella cellulosilytica DSM 2522]
MWTLIVLTLILIIFLILRMKKPSYLTTMEQDEFRKDYRKAQLIDVREEREFNTGYILGARNIPLSQIRQRKAEIRPDKPVYLYCQNGTRCVQAAKFLRKKRGVENIVMLKGGFRKWSGKIKK